MTPEEAKKILINGAWFYALNPAEIDRDDYRQLLIALDLATEALNRMTLNDVKCNQ